jgi:hypothetical protein
VPSAPLVLGPVGSSGASCVIAFSFDVVQRPLDGVTAVAVAFASPSFPEGRR